MRDRRTGLSYQVLAFFPLLHLIQSSLSLDPLDSGSGLSFFF